MCQFIPGLKVLGFLDTRNKMEKIGFHHEALGYCNQGFHIFFATELQQSETARDVTEAGMEHLKMTVQEFEEAVINGQITDAPTISAYGLLKMKQMI